MTEPSPALFFETMNAFQRTECLKAAIELDVFTAIGEGAATPSALASRCQASERGLRILCDFLTVLGFLIKSDGSYALTPDSAKFLDRRSPYCISSAAEFLAAPTFRLAFERVKDAVQKGGTALPDSGTVTPDNSVWVDFARCMAPRTIEPAQRISKILGAGAWSVLDIAAGHGMFGLTIARDNPQARVTAVDSAAVLELAGENAARLGVAGRFTPIPGSAFEVDLGRDYDVVLLTNFLHHFSPKTCESLLKRVHAALKPGGRAATLDYVPDPDRVSPPLPAMFSMMMLATTPDGDAYTFPEYCAMFTTAGFSKNERHEIPPTPQTLIVSYR